jgi:protein SCO1/2
MKGALVALALLLSVPAVADARFDPFAAAKIDPPPHAAVPPDAPFSDEKGRVVRLGDYFGARPIVLAPVYFECPNICGTTLTQLARAVDASGLKPGLDFTLVALSFDKEEGPAQAAQAAARIPTRPIHLLTGTQPAIDTVTGALGFHYAWDKRLGQFAHASAVAVLMPDGRLSRWLYGLSYQPEDLRLAVVEAGHGVVGTIADRILLLCYHYDPVTGRYGGLVWTALRIGGAICILGLLGYAAARVRRERRRLS